MKKKILIVVSLVLIVTMSLGFTPKAVQAESSEWNTGTDVVIDLSLHPLPETWLQLFGNGVKVDGSTTICHSFRQGGYGWTPVIYQLTANGWVALDTTNTRANEESEYQACAIAPVAGTYALFAYYKQPVSASMACAYDTSLWSVGTFNAADYPDQYPGVTGTFLSAYVVYLPVGTKVTMTLISGYDGFSMNSRGNGFVYDVDDNQWVDFMTAPITSYSDGTIIVRLSALGCSANYEVEIPPTEIS